jgi:hypothetical protein
MIETKTWDGRAVPRAVFEGKLHAETAEAIQRREEMWTLGGEDLSKECVGADTSHRSGWTAVDDVTYDDDPRGGEGAERNYPDP